MSEPTELAVTLAALPNRYTVDGWSYADEVRGRLKLLGFDCSGQKVVAMLTRMSEVDAPWIERRLDPWGGPWKYRVTQWGRNDIDNRLPVGRPLRVAV